MIDLIWEYITLPSFEAIQLHGFISSVAVDFQSAIITTSHIVFRSRSGGLEELGKADWTVDFSSAISSESNRQSRTRFVFRSIFHEKSGLILFTMAIIFFKTSAGTSIFPGKLTLFKSFIDHWMTSGSLRFLVVLYQHKPEMYFNFSSHFAL